MQTAVGIFRSRSSAERAIKALLDSGISSQSIIFLSGEQSERGLKSVPTTEGEPDGMGPAMGALVGGAVGASAGLSLGTAIASLVVPGVGPVLAAGLGAAAALGLGGAVAGGEIGDATEKKLDVGVPRDEVSLYRELLKRKRSVVIVNTNSSDQAALANSIFEQNDGEDAATAHQHLHDVT
jgi:hypothetical protein